MSQPDQSFTLNEQHTGSASSQDDVRDLLLALTREMATAASMDVLLQKMVDAALRIVPAADKCVIHLLDRSGTRLETRFCSRPSLATGESPGMPANMGIAGKALRERRTIAVADVTQEPGFVALRSGNDLRSLLVAPLYAAEIPLGTLSLNSHRVGAFSATDAQNISTLAAQAAVVIRQAQLLQEATSEQQRNQAIIESIADGLVLLDGEGRVQRLNPALRRMLELEDSSLPSPCPPCDPACPPVLRQLLDPSGGEVMGPYTLELVLPSGNQLVAQVTPCPLPPPCQGEVRVVHDITAERRAAQERALFISQVAHELRTPLQHIMGFSSLISDIDDLSREQYVRFCGHIQDETYYLARLIDDLLELSRLESGRFSLRLERVQLDALLERILGKLAARAEFRGLALTCANAPQPIWVVTDAVRVEQVLGNLIENAFKFVPPGGRIHVSLTQERDYALVRVADSGPGIPKEALAHIFEPFYQANTPAQRQNLGLGLGLYISHQIVTALGGKIWVESEEGRGTVFSFSLPISN